MASTISSYNNDKVVTGEVEYPANDPASGAFFQPDFKRNEDLKMMLDGSKDSLKLEAMKRIIGMIAKGRDASDLFPAVVKNVVSKNIEVKKLVYVYLVRYAEQQQDLALLSISTFQRALKDPNQLIRASALRVLSSIRVSMIVPIVMLAIRDSAADMSPYVRKTAAHAIPKLYSLDPEQKEELVSIIEKLLSDKAPLVVGSAAMAFQEVCAEQLSLLHKSYRKLCLLLADVDEWGQCALLNVLTVYARTYFPDPDAKCTESDSETEKPFYDSDSDGSRRPRSPTVDPDLRLLLRAAKPLLQSRSSSVVLAVARLFHHTAPAQEMPPVVKAMIRLLRAPVEVQSVVLNTIASLTVTKRQLFEPYLKSFYVRMSDPTHIKLLKLEILTNLCSEANAPAVLRELQTYVACSDRALAAAAIQAIGRAALAVETETQSCLNAALHLLSSKHEWVVCEAVLVVKRALGAAAPCAAQAVARAARLLQRDRLAPAARAAAVWLVAEHGAPHPRAAAVLAHLAATFPDQEELVKLQLLSLAAKLSVTQPDTLPLVNYVFTLARYDVSYDVRDRARLLSKLCGGRGAAKALLAPKPAPSHSTRAAGSQHFTLGSLSQYIGRSAAGYLPLPAAPAQPLPGALRDTPADPAVADTVTRKSNREQRKDKSFYSEPESTSGSTASSSSDDSSSEESSDEDEASGSDAKDNKKEKTKKSNEINNSGRRWYRDLSTSKSSTSDSESDSSSSDESEDESESSEDEPQNTPPKEKGPLHQEKKAPEAKSSDKSNLELLLELDAVASQLPTMTPTCGGLLTPARDQLADDAITAVGASFVPSTVCELLSRVSCGGLGASRRWLRAPHLYHTNMVTVEIIFTNYASENVNNIRVNKKTLTGTRSLHDFTPIPTLAPGASASVTLGVHFADSIQPIEFTIASSVGEFSASITPPVGELMRAATASAARWRRERDALRGMHECEKKVSMIYDVSAITQRVFETANVAAIPSDDDTLCFLGILLSSQEPVLLGVAPAPAGRVRAHCAQPVVAAMLASDVAQRLAA